MLIARFEFTEEGAEALSWGGKEQTIVQMEFESPQELIYYCSQYEQYIKECTVFTGDGLIVLSSFGENTKKSSASC
jgi:hypothetical protein